MFYRMGTIFDQYQLSLEISSLFNWLWQSFGVKIEIFTCSDKICCWTRNIKKPTSPFNKKSPKILNYRQMEKTMTETLQSVEF